MSGLFTKDKRACRRNQVAKFLPAGEHNQQKESKSTSNISGTRLCLAFTAYHLNTWNMCIRLHQSRFEERMSAVQVVRGDRPRSSKAIGRFLFIGQASFVSRFWPSLAIQTREIPIALLRMGDCTFFSTAIYVPVIQRLLVYKWCPNNSEQRGVDQIV